jgi:hypothetical protein
MFFTAIGAILSKGLDVYAGIKTAEIAADAQASQATSQATASTNTTKVLMFGSIALLGAVLVFKMFSD